MFVSKFVSLAAVMAPAVFAAPSASAAKPAMYLVNCIEFNQLGSSFSQMAFFRNNTAARAGSIDPDDSANVGDADGGVRVTWEGAPVKGFFQISGKNFTSNINAGAQSQAVNAKVGTGLGYNSAKENWNCFKDNGFNIYDTAFATCDSIYYCFEA